MHASEFQRKRAKIERRAGSRAAFLRKAMGHLVRDAGAVAVVVRGKHLGWRMADGGMVCVKQRHRDEAAAQQALAMIARDAKGLYVPVRAYACAHCGGWHLTSQARNDRAAQSSIHGSK